MQHFLIRSTYSSGSWARLLKSTDDRTAAARSLIESLGGSLDCIYWNVGSCAAYAIAHLPDSVTAAAITVAVNKTGAFKNVEVEELLTQDRLGDALALAKDASSAYAVPGQSAVEPNI